MGLRFTIPGANWSAARTIGLIPSPQRYWRLSMVPGSTYITAEDIEFRQTAGGADVSGSAVSYTASSTISGAAPISNAFDGDPDSQWQSAENPPSPVTITLDFGGGNEKLIAEIAFRSWAAAPQWAPQSIAVLFSSDGTIWQQLWSQGGLIGWAAGVAKIITKP